MIINLRKAYKKLEFIIPTPNEGEDQQKFVSRCMGSDLMNKEYPDQEQRAAICYSQWRDKDKKKS